MKTLYLLRHAKAELAKGQEMDFDRALSGSGRDACSFIGSCIREKNYYPEIIITSSARRTRETFELVKDSANIKQEAVSDAELYTSTADDLVAKIKDFSEPAESAMIIGHNPTMHHLALMLAGNQESELYHILQTKYPTGALTVIKFFCETWQDVAPGKGMVTDFIVP